MDLLLNENLELNVRILESKYGKLKINYGNIPTLSYVDNYSHNIDKDVIQVEDLTDLSLNKYLLSGPINSENNLDKLFKYVYSGKAETNKIKTVYFTFPELGAYFNKEISKHLNKKGDLSGNVTIEPMETTLHANEQVIKVKLQQSYGFSELSTKDGFMFTSSMNLVFEFEKIITFTDIEKYMVKSESLFTWITGFPIKASKITVSDGENTGTLYIPTVKNTSEYDLSYPKSFMQVPRLRNNFGKICNSYFIKNTFEFKNIWSRTIPLYNFDGVLEYEVMLYASILDKYCSYKLDKLNLNSALNDDEYNEFTSKFSALISENEKLSNTFSKKIFPDLRDPETVKRILPNRSIATFNQKVKTYLTHIHNGVTDVFISKDDLYSIKGIRDRAAHGEIENIDRNEVYKKYFKLRMLIIYLIYKDLGVSDNEFLHIIYSGRNSLILNCDIDKFKLDCKLKMEISLPVSKPVFDELSSTLKINIVIVRDGNLYNADKAYTTMLNTFLRDKSSKIKFNDEYIQTFLNDSKLKAKYHNKVYVVHKGKHHPLHGVILVDKDRN